MDMGALGARNPVRLAGEPNPVVWRSGRSAMFVAWDRYSVEAGAATTTWPANPTAPDDALAIGVGHRHLCRLLLVHDILTNDGVATACDTLSPGEIAQAIDACTYFELPDLAAAVADIPLAGASPGSARVFDAEYRRRYAMTDRVVEAILDQIVARPSDFPGSEVAGGGADS